MKIKRFIAADIRQALRQVRETLGADAVILSNKSVDGGIELVAAMDYDEAAFETKPKTRTTSVRPVPVETNSGTGTGTGPRVESRSRVEAPAKNVSEPETRPTSVVGRHKFREEPADRSPAEYQDPVLQEMRGEMQALRRMMENQLSELAWTQMGSRNPQSQELLRRLMQLDLSPDICSRLTRSLQDVENSDQAWRKALHLLAGELPVAGESLIEDGGVVALIGPTGVGKTTTIAKLAARFVLRHGHRHLALVSTDSYRIGAQEQLNTYARILDVPVRRASTPDELHATLNSLSDKRLVLVDTAGMSQQDVRLSEQLSLFKSGNRQVRTFLTLSANTQQAALEQAIESFGTAGTEGCILTKLDEAASLGGVLSAVVHSGLPIAFYTDGQKVPEDIHVARAHTLVNRAVTLGERSGTEYDDEYLALALGGVRADAHV
ncbi:MAG: flagellar biosynthesis protein FlhF [Gammaproteobacteria bacterium]|nr:flagellar biosynthesis protein FlhF [Gammaproteobacteria bacterium]